MSVVEKFERKLDHFSLSINNWEILDEGFTVLWGDSGAGKTSLLRGLIGFDHKAIVRWKFKGSYLDELPIGDRRLGVVFQEPSLFPHMSVEKNILFPVSSKNHKNWQADFNNLIEELDIGQHIKSPVMRLSGGEKQRVAIARALISRPQMLVLDEPFSSLDEKVRVKVRAMLKSLCNKFECPALLVTHDSGDVIDLANKVSHIKHGEIIEEMSPQDFSNRT